MRITIGRRSYRPSQIRKAIVVGAGMTIEVGNQLAANLVDIAPPAVHATLSGIVAIATTVLAFAVKNAPLIDAGDDA